MRLTLIAVLLFAISGLCFAIMPKTVRLDTDHYAVLACKTATREGMCTNTIVSVGNSNNQYLPSINLSQGIVGGSNVRVQRITRISDNRFAVALLSENRIIFAIYASNGIMLSRQNSFSINIAADNVLDMQIAPASVNSGIIAAVSMQMTNQVSTTLLQFSDSGIRIRETVITSSGVIASLASNKRGLVAATFTNGNCADSASDNFVFSYANAFRQFTQVLTLSDTCTSESVVAEFITNSILALAYESNGNAIISTVSVADPLIDDLLIDAPFVIVEDGLEDDTRGSEVDSFFFATIGFVVRARTFFRSGTVDSIIRPTNSLTLAPETARQVNQVVLTVNRAASPIEAAITTRQCRTAILGDCSLETAFAVLDANAPRMTRKMVEGEFIVERSILPPRLGFDKIVNGGAYTLMSYSVGCTVVNTQTA